MQTLLETNEQNFSRAGNWHSLLNLPPVEPWGEPVEGAALLDELARVLRRFVVLPKWAAETLALWIVHTYAFELRDVTTYIGLESPEKRCGKTTLLTVLSELVNRPVVAANISSPAFYRLIEEAQPTLLIDEADTFLHGNDDLRGILNSGYARKTSFVVRVAGSPGRRSAERSHRENIAGRSGKFEIRNPKSETNSKTWNLLKEEDENRETVSQAASEFESGQSPGGARTLLSAAASDEGDGSGSQADLRTDAAADKNVRAPVRVSALARYSCWCPKAMATIGRLPDTLGDRCILIRMERRLPSEQCERLRSLDTAALKRQCARFVLDRREAIANARPEAPAILNDRAADIWEPLLALADLAGGRWPELAREAAVGLTAEAQDNSPIGSLLLDILLAFAKGGQPRLFARALVGELKWYADRPWLELLKGRELTELWLAQRLRPYGLRPRNIRVEGIQAKGYALEDFQEAFRRYIPMTEVEALRAEVTAGDGEQEKSAGGEI